MIVMIQCCIYIFPNGRYKRVISLLVNVHNLKFTHLSRDSYKHPFQENIYKYPISFD